MAYLEELSPDEEVIEFYVNSKIGELQKDGTYMVSISNNSGNVNTIYDPNPAKRYLRKYKAERIKNG